MVWPLADLDQHAIASGLDAHGRDESIQPRAVKPHRAAENFFTVEPDRKIVVRAATELGTAVRRRLNLGVRVSDGLVCRAQGANEVDRAERIVRALPRPVQVSSSSPGDAAPRSTVRSGENDAAKPDIPGAGNGPTTYQSTTKPRCSMMLTLSPAPRDVPQPLSPDRPWHVQRRGGTHGGRPSRRPGFSLVPFFHGDGDSVAAEFRVVQKGRHQGRLERRLDAVQQVDASRRDRPARCGSRTYASISASGISGFERPNSLETIRSYAARYQLAATMFDVSIATSAAARYSDRVARAPGTLRAAAEPLPCGPTAAIAAIDGSNASATADRADTSRREAEKDQYSAPSHARSLVIQRSGSSFLMLTVFPRRAQGDARWWKPTTTASSPLVRQEKPG